MSCDVSDSAGIACSKGMSNAECIRCVFKTQTAVTSLCKVGEH